MGLFENTETLLRESRSQKNDLIYLAGNPECRINGSHFGRKTGSPSDNTPFGYFPEREKAFRSAALKTARETLASSGQAIAGGGLLISLSKICIASGIGIRLEIPHAMFEPEFLFGESGARAIYSVPISGEREFISTWSGVPLMKIGEARGSELSVNENFSIPIQDLDRAWRG